MTNALLNKTRFRIAFSTWWWLWSGLHGMVISQAHFSWKTAVIDSVVCNLLLAGAVLLVAVTLQYYTPQKNRYGYLFSLCAALSLLWLFGSRIVLLTVQQETGYDAFLSQSLLLRGAIGYLVLNCMALISVLWYTIQDQQGTEQRKTEAERLSREAELASLRQQLQPHFLFNSLNSINALIGLQPQKARTMIQQLSDFLRGTLKKDQKEWTSLEDELQHLQLYLEIEKVRFGHRLNATVKNEANGAQLPVMLLQPVVENAIKFGLYDTTETVTITIAAKEENKNLLIEVTNPFDPETSLPQKGTGFGLRSVQRRLSLLFARHDLLQTQIHNTIFVTTIKIPQP
ncbi:MAG TPA: histidine kinase [Flavisolibacter sp.]|nr:histidine kinase [Flavisolibacter sp.]